MTRQKQTKQSRGYDRFLLLGMLVLLGMGVVMVYSASSMVAMKRFGSDTFFFNRQVVHALVAVLVLVCCRHVPYSLYKTLAYPILGIALVSLVALYVPGVGQAVGGAKRWLRAFGVSFQPSEFARLAVIIYLAYSLSKKQEKIKEFSVGFLPHAILFACFAILRGCARVLPHSIFGGHCAPCLLHDDSRAIPPEKTPELFGPMGIPG